MRSAFALLLISAGFAYADGKMYWREKVPPKMPYQRGLILFRDGMETLVLQSRYQLPQKSAEHTLGWVVPVPGVPEVASLRADYAQSLFGDLAMVSGPRVTRVGETFLLVSFLTLGVLPMLALLLCLLSLFIPCLSWIKTHRTKLVRYSLFGLLFCLLIALIVPGFVDPFLILAGLPALALLLCLLSLFIPFLSRIQRHRRRPVRYSLIGLLICFLMVVMVPSLNSARGMEGVDVIAEQRVGIYDVRVVKAQDSLELIRWLNENKFEFEKADKTVFDAYVANGWSFVVAYVNPTSEHEGGEVVSEGLVAPLILRFPHNAPIYPVALTSVAAHDTEILLYVVAQNKVTCGDRLKLCYGDSRDMYRGVLELLQTDVEPEGFFKPEDLSLPYLCKFKDTLTPSQMKEDISFTAAPDNRAYREHVVKW